MKIDWFDVMFGLALTVLIGVAIALIVLLGVVVRGELIKQDYMIEHEMEMPKAADITIGGEIR